MKTIEDIFDALLDGTKDQIEDLAGSGAAYRYVQSCGSFAVSFGQDEIRAHKLTEPPACVRWHGPDHAF